MLRSGGTTDVTGSSSPASRIASARPLPSTTQASGSSPASSYACSVRRGAGRPHCSGSRPVSIPCSPGASRSTARRWPRGGRRSSFLRKKRGVGLMFQDYALFPHLTVEQNIGFGLRNGTRDGGWIERALADMHLAHLGAPVSAHALRRAAAAHSTAASACARSRHPAARRTVLRTGRAPEAARAPGNSGDARRERRHHPDGDPQSRGGDVSRGSDRRPEQRGGWRRTLRPSTSTPPPRIRSSCACSGRRTSSTASCATACSIPCSVRSRPPGWRTAGRRCASFARMESRSPPHRRVAARGMCALQVETARVLGPTSYLLLSPVSGKASGPPIPNIEARLPGIHAPRDRQRGLGARARGADLRLCSLSAGYCVGVAVPASGGRCVLPGHANAQLP